MFFAVCLIGLAGFLFFNNFQKVAESISSGNISLGTVTSTVITSGQGGAQRYNGFPGITRLPNGNLVVAYYGGSDDDVHSGTCDEETANSKIYYKISTDQGVTWGSEAVLYEVGSDTVGPRDPEITLLQNGKVIVSFFKYDYSVPGTTASAFVIMGTANPDGTMTWGSPIAVSSLFTLYAGTSSKVIELANGILLLPIYGRNTGDTKDRSAIIKSTDWGISWGNQVTMAGTGTGTDEYSEANGVVLSTGRIVVLIRHEGEGWVRVYSDDNGATWSAPGSDVIDDAGGVPGRPTVVLLGSGGLFFMGRITTIPGQSTIYGTSWDEGTTWSLGMPGWRGSNYESAVTLSGGEVGAIHSLGPYGTSGITYQNFDFCADECTTSGTKTCSGNGYKTCGNYDSDSCLEWSLITNCPSGQTCSNGQCSATCGNECTSGATRCSNDYAQTCGNYDSDLCTEWNTGTYCSYGCLNNSCNNTPTCSNECSTSGTKECSNTGYKTCGNYDSDSCLEWSSVTNCSTGQTCSNGQCNTTCTDECTSGAKRCSSNYAQVCGNYNTDSCQEWNTGTYCNSGCSNGQCNNQITGTLLKFPSDNRVYEIISDKKLWIPTAEAFNKIGYSWSNVQTVDESTLNGYPRIKLVRASGDPKTYYLTESGLKRWIPTEAIFNSYNNNWKDVIEISSAKLTAIPDATLIKLQNGVKVYELKNSQKRWIETATAFNKLDFDWNKICPVNQEEFNYYKDGSVIK